MRITSIGACTLTILAVSPLLAADKPDPLVIVTDASWKGTQREVQDWQTEKGADGDWQAAVPGPGPGVECENFGTANMFAFATKARWIWSAGEVHFAGPSDLAYLRRTFKVSRDYHRAEMLFAADDVADVYINGCQIYGYDTAHVEWGSRGCSLLVDLVPYLKEGKNLIAARVTNRVGPKGFAAEIRIDGEPFVSLPESPKPLPKELQKEIDALARGLDDEDFAAREAAQEKFLDLIEKHGALLKDKLEELKLSGSVEVRTRAEKLYAALVRKAPELASTADPRLQIPPLSMDALAELLRSSERKPVVAMRYLLPARKLLADNEKGVTELLSKTLQGATAIPAERIVAYISFLEITSLDKALEQILKDNPKSSAAPLAASALGRLGNPAHAKVLVAASECGYEQTECAARHALRLLKDEPPDKKTPPELQGVWKLVTLEIDGKPVDLNAQPRWVIKDDKVQYGGLELAVLTADASTTPRSIDLELLNPKGTYEGIYSVDKDTLKICLNAQSTGVKERPLEFATKDKGNLRLLVFEREQGKLADPTEGASGYIGVMLRQNQEPKEVVVVDAIDGSPAKKAGLKKDDILVKVSDAEATDLRSVVGSVRKIKPGAEITWRVKRDGKELDITFKATVLPFHAVAQLE